MESELTSQELSTPSTTMPAIETVAAWRAAHQRVVELDQQLEQIQVRRRALGEQIKDLIAKERITEAEIRRLTAHRRPLVSARFDAAKKMMHAAPIELQALDAALRQYEKDMRAEADVDWDALARRLHVIRTAESWLRDLVQHPEQGHDPLRVQAQAIRLDESLPGFANVFSKSMESFT